MRRLLLLLAAVLPVPAQAQALELVPTTLHLPAAQGRTELWLRNPGPGHWRGQLQVWAWDQQQDAEHLQRSGQVLASPTLLDLPAGARQRVWLLPASSVPVAAEQAFRIILAPAEAGMPRYSLPLFRGEPSSPARPRLQVEVMAGASQPMLRLQNGGTGHARLSDLSYETADGQRSLLLPGLAGYVLAARRRQWSLPPRADGYAGGRFHVRLQDGADVILTPSLPPIAASQPSGL
ncbi:MULTISPECIES: molecular chaperone [unclassified Stenotrophomonas]|uniref:fimbrial biogenesis chaperone n=1 Tax=unclassified Stenotrophomonas TaxID=196198 RepID=UPI00104372BF|nr:MULTISPECIES: fimbria/pilus periplasmic chaperone [unclassified Stenotrophomonas]MDV3513530.1 fimbria/pilus periplasmic chaperone [Stenotrophomonas sp. C1657]TDB34475.1 molecular chaperone [Stenotrophomonas sp. TEPEL]